MSVERRLRQGFHRNADTLEPEVDKFLSMVVQRTRRRVIVHRMVAFVAIAAVVIGVVVLGPRVLDAIRSSKLEVPAATPSDSTTANAQAAAGTFLRRLDPTTAATRTDKMAGWWFLGVTPAGRMTVHAPPRFTGVVSGYWFRIQGNAVRTNLFAQDVCTSLPPGVYLWSRSGRGLTFKIADDQCEARVAFFASGAWESVAHDSDVFGFHSDFSPR